MPALTYLLRAVERSGAVDGDSDARELRGRGLAEERHGGDAHDGDERNEKRVLDERGTTIGLAAGLEPRAGKFVRGKHYGDLP